MSAIYKSLYSHYKVFRPTSLINDDIKTIRRFNFLQRKYIDTNEAKYKHESINIIKTINNLFHINHEFLSLIKNKFIETEHHTKLDEITDEIKR